ncbi:MAG: UbiA family prenyltransferase [Patescibacteria group bacterium]|nr:UbiA family prenyltransferase [Patescibacteria group bacterium]
MEKIDKIVSFLEKGPLSIRTWIVSFGGIVAARILIESLVFSFEQKTFDEFLGIIFGTVLFFLFSYIVLLVVLRFLVKEKIEKLASVLLWGQWMIIIPPIVDKLIFGDRKYWSFYIFGSVKEVIIKGLTFFGENPSFGITWGTRLLVLITVVGLGLYVFYKKRKIVWFFIGAISVYLVLYILGAFPSFVSFVILPFAGVGLFAIEAEDIAKQFLTSLQLFGIENSGIKVVLHYKMGLVYNPLLFVFSVFLLFVSRRRWFFALAKNVRYPQMIFNCGLFFLGVGLGWMRFPQNFGIDFFEMMALANAILAIFFAWYFSVVVNDLADIEIDQISNQDRPLTSGAIKKSTYSDFGLIFALFALLSSLVVSKVFFLIIVGYLLVTWVYSSHPFRLKRFVLVSSILSSFASLFFLLGGYLLISDFQTLQFFPWRIISFLFIAYAFLIPLKDIKDIEGDQAKDVETLPVVLGEENARIFLGVVLFVNYVLSPVIVDERSLFLPAVLFGGISYWVITNQKHKPKTLPWWVLGIVTIYGMLLVLMIF